MDDGQVSLDLSLALLSRPPSHTGMVYILTVQTNKTHTHNPEFKYTYTSTIQNSHTNTHAHRKKQLRNRRICLNVLNAASIDTLYGTCRTIFCGEPSTNSSQTSPSQPAETLGETDWQGQTVGILDACYLKCTFFLSQTILDRACVRREKKKERYYDIWWKECIAFHSLESTGHG